MLCSTVKFLCIGIIPVLIAADLQVAHAESSTNTTLHACTCHVKQPGYSLLALVERCSLISKEDELLAQTLSLIRPLNPLIASKASSTRAVCLCLMTRGEHPAIQQVINPCFNALTACYAGSLCGWDP